MGATVRAHQGDTLDLIVHRAYGRTADITEEALELNRGISALGAEIPQGTEVILPSPPTSAPEEKSEIQLWD